MSTTTRKQVALTYASHGRKAIVLELHVGQVNCGEAQVLRISADMCAGESADSSTPVSRGLHGGTGVEDIS